MADPTGTVLGERVKGYVDQKLLPTVADGVFNGNILLYRLFNNPQPWTGGVQMQRSIIVNQSSQGGSFSGSETFETSAEDLTVRLAFDKKNVYQPVTVLGTEKTLNAGEAGKIQLVTNQMEMAKMNLSNRLGSMIYKDGTGNSSNDILGLRAIVDDGTNASTYGGQTRATYGSALDASLTTGLGTITLDHMATQVDNATGTGGQETEPTLIVTTKAVYSFVEALITPTVQHNFGMSMPPMRLYSTGPAQQYDPQMGQQGFKALAWRGIPIVADEQCPTGRMYFLNEHELAFYSLTDPDLKSVPVKNLNTVKGSVYNNAPNLSPCQWRGWMPVPNQYGETGQFIVQGQLISWNPRRHAATEGITGS